MSNYTVDSLVDACIFFVHKASPKGADAGDAAAKTPTSSSDEMPKGVKFADKEKKAWDVQLAKLAKAEKAQADKDAKEKAKEDKAQAEKEKKDAVAAEKEAKELAAKDAKVAAAQAKLDAKAAKVLEHAQLTHLNILAR
jgi:phage protein D